MSQHQQTNEWLDLVIARAVDDHIVRAHVVPGALVVARDVEGDCGDAGTRRLVSLLNSSLQDALDRDDELAISCRAAELLAALSSLADAGDEAIAIDINSVVPLLAPDIVADSLVWARSRAN